MFDASTSQFTAVRDAKLQAGTSLSNFASQAFTGDNSSFSFNITAFTPQTSVAEAYRVSIDGVMQSPTDAYSISMSPAQITFLGTAAPPTGSKIVVVTAASAASAVSVDDVTIGLTSDNKAEIKDLGVTNAKLAGGITQDKLAGGITNAQLAGSIATSKLAEVIDDGTMTTGVSATSLASSESIKTYVDGKGITQSTGSAPYYGVRAWASYSGTSNTLHASGNITSVTKHGTGDYEFFFDESMPVASPAISLSYSAEVSATINATLGQQHTVCFIASRNANSFRINTYAVSSSGHKSDKGYIGVSVIC